MRSELAVRGDKPSVVAAEQFKVAGHFAFQNADLYAKLYNQFAQTRGQNRLLAKTPGSVEK
jgi:hypothetical protein